MAIIIRNAVIEDLPEIYSNELSYIREIEPENESRWLSGIPNHLRQWIEMIPATYVLTDEREIIGHCAWVPDDNRALLCSIYVRPPFRRQGFAGRLLSHFEKAASDSGFRESILGVFIGNPAEKLYLSAGYRFVRSTGEYNYYSKTLAE